MENEGSIESDFESFITNYIANNLDRIAVMEFEATLHSQNSQTQRLREDLAAILASEDLGYEYGDRNIIDELPAYCQEKIFSVTDTKSTFEAIYKLQLTKSKVLVLDAFIYAHKTGSFTDEELQVLFDNNFDTINQNIQNHLEIVSVFIKSVTNGMNLQLLDLLQDNISEYYIDCTDNNDILTASSLDSNNSLIPRLNAYSNIDPERVSEAKIYLSDLYKEQIKTSFPSNMVEVVTKAMNQDKLKRIVFATNLFNQIQNEIYSEEEPGGIIGYYEFLDIVEGSFVEVEVVKDIKVKVRKLSIHNEQGVVEERYVVPTGYTGINEDIVYNLVYKPIATLGYEELSSTTDHANDYLQSKGYHFRMEDTFGNRTKGLDQAAYISVKLLRILGIDLFERLVSDYENYGLADESIFKLGRLDESLELISRSNYFKTLVSSYQAKVSQGADAEEEYSTIINQVKALSHVWGNPTFGSGKRIIDSLVEARNYESFRHFSCNASEEERKDLIAEVSQAYAYYKEIVEYSENLSLIHGLGINHPRGGKIQKFVNYMLDSEQFKPEETLKLFQEYKEIISYLMHHYDGKSRFSHVNNLPEILNYCKLSSESDINLSQLFELYLVENKTEFLEGLLNKTIKPGDILASISETHPILGSFLTTVLNSDELRKMLALNTFKDSLVTFTTKIIQNPGILDNAISIMKSLELDLGDMETSFIMRLCNQQQDVIAWITELVTNANQKERFKKILLNPEFTDGRIETNLHDLVLQLRNFEAGIPTEEERAALFVQLTSKDALSQAAQSAQVYNVALDKFLDENGKRIPMVSIRDLHMRASMIRANFDWSNMPESTHQWADAPGLNYIALVKMFNGPHKEKYLGVLNGDLDAGQPFKPHRQIYTTKNLEDVFKNLLGGKTKHNPQVTDQVNQLKSEISIIIQKYNSNNETPSEDLIWKEISRGFIRDEIRLELVLAAISKGIDLGDVVLGEVHNKSDAYAWVCGNYTDCCMPLGAANNDDYILNPGTQYQTWSRVTLLENGNLSRRIIAQSVLYEGTNTASKNNAIVCDNIEVAKNYTKYNPLLAQAFTSFWKEYLRGFDEFNTHEIKIGTSHNDLLIPGSNLEKNNINPKTNLKSSDSRGHTIYNVPVELHKGDKKILRHWNEYDIKEIVKYQKLWGKREVDLETLQYNHDIVEEDPEEFEIPLTPHVLQDSKREISGAIVMHETPSDVLVNQNVVKIKTIVTNPKNKDSFKDFVKLIRTAFSNASMYGYPIEFEADDSIYDLLQKRIAIKYFSKRNLSIKHKKVRNGLTPDAKYVFVIGPSDQVDAA